MGTIEKIKHVVKKIPFVGTHAVKLYKGKSLEFRNSNQYWNDRYKKGGNSGAGSYNRLARFKADVLNNFVLNNKVQSVIEFGCGDGNNLTYCHFPFYVGYDISAEALERCAALFSGDDTKQFRLQNQYNNETADLTLSLDVIYHLIEDDVFDVYMRTLFGASTHFVIIYASNKNEIQTAHVKHRKFTDWIETNIPGFKLMEFIPNKYPYDATDLDNTSFANFYIFCSK